MGGVSIFISQLSNESLASHYQLIIDLEDSRKLWTFSALKWMARVHGTIFTSLCQNQPPFSS